MRTEALSLTGVGALTPLGVGVDALAAALAAGTVATPTAIAAVDEPHRSGAVDPILAGVPAPLRRVASAVEPPAARGNGDGHRLPRITRLALAAAREALAGAALEAEPTRIGLVLATALGPLAEATAFVRGYLAEGAATASPLLFAQATPGAIAGHLAIELGLRGPSATVHHRDTSPLGAVAIAARWLQLGRADAVVVAAVDEASAVTLHGYARAGALTAERTRPYDRDRDGFVLADAAAAFVLERSAAARARRARERARLVAVTESGDDGARLGWRRRTHDGAVAALREAATMAERVDWIAGGGNGTALDALELEVLTAALGPSLPPISSIVGQTGESPASAALRLVAAVVALERGLLPGTAGVAAPLAACAASLVRAPRAATVERVLVPSLGQGGANVIVALGRA